MELKEYIRNNYKTLDAVQVYKTYESAKSQEETEKDVKGVIENFSKDVNEEGDLRVWCFEQVIKSYPILQTPRTTAYWSVFAKAQTKILSDFAVVNATHNIMKSIVCPSTDSSTAPNDVVSLSPQYIPQVEQDPILFGNKSVGTIIKEHGINLFNNYKSLTEKQKYIMGLCLNSVLDLADESDDGQMAVLFSEEERVLIKQKYMKIYTIKDPPFFDNLSKIKKALKGLDLQRAYTLARKGELKFSGDEKKTFYIIAHVLNAYIKRPYLFKEVTKLKPTEYDALIKLWGELLEELFAFEKIYLKWGESVMGASTIEKNLNYNDGGRSKVGFKIDCRVLVFVNKQDEVDLSPAEAAREFTDDKINGDHLKLLTESKCITNNFVTNCKTLDVKTFKVMNLQLSGNKANLNALRLPENGLYANVPVTSFSIPNTVTEFGENLTSWLKGLFLYLDVCRKQNLLADELDTNRRRSFGQHFRSQTNNNPPPALNNKQRWTRGCYFPPADPKAAPVFPRFLYTPPSLIIAGTKRTFEEIQHEEQQEE